MSITLEERFKKLEKKRDKIKKECLILRRALFTMKSIYCENYCNHRTPGLSQKQRHNSRCQEVEQILSEVQDLEQE